jgi:uncharacterized protein Veg
VNESLLEKRVFQVVFYSLDSRKRKEKKTGIEKSIQASMFVIRHQSLTHEK